MAMLATRIGDDVLLLILNGGPANAMSSELAGDLRACLTDIPADIAAIVVSGTDGGAFCAGSDIAELDRDGPEALLNLEGAALDALAEAPVVTIAAVDGVAFGGGMELAACCDFVVAGGKARFGLPEVRLGVFPGLGAPVRVTRRIGYTRALEMMLLGSEIDAETALRWHFANFVVPAGETTREALKLARRLASGPRDAIRMIRQSMREAVGRDDAEAISSTLARAITHGESAEAEEGLRAFMARQKPDFRAARASAGSRRGRKKL